MQTLLEKISQKIKKTPKDTTVYEDMYYICKEASLKDLPLALTYTKILCEAISERLVSETDENTIYKLFGLHKKSLLILAPHDFDSYLLALEWDRDEEKKFYAPRRRVLKQVVDAMQDLLDDKLDLLTISMPPGTGKAQPLWSKVLTPDGFVEMGSLKVGDTILTNKGEHSKITHIFPQGIKPYYKVTFSDGTVTHATSDHLWRVQTRDDRRKDRHGGKEVYRTVTTSQMTKNLLVEGGRKNYAIDYIKPLSFEAQTLPLDPYLLGVLLGDGTLTNACITLSNPDGEIIERVQEVLPEGDKLTQSQYNSIQYRISKMQDLRDKKGYPIPSKTAHALKSLGLYGTRSDDKFIPPIYLRSTLEDKFTRRNYEAIQSKSQVLVSMLGEPKIHPRLAFLHSGLFTDAESAYAMSMKHYESLTAEGNLLNQNANEDVQGSTENAGGSK